MPQIFNDVKIDGNADVTQLTVEGHTTQTQPLQMWQTSAGDSLGQLTGDGRLTMGDDLGGATPDSLVEVHRADTSTGKPKRGFHSLGRITGALSEAVNWSVHELELLGNGVISTLQTALRVRLSSSNSANSSSGELRAADIEANNQAGTINEVTAVQATVKSQNTATITEARGIAVSVAKDSEAAIGTAYGVKVEDVNGATNNYALHTGSGITHLGDTLELKVLGAAPTPPVSGDMRLYPRNGGTLYAQHSSGHEYTLTNPILLYDNTLLTNGTFPVVDLTSTSIPDGTTCVHLEILLLLRSLSTFYAGNTYDWFTLFFNNDPNVNNYWFCLNNIYATAYATSQQVGAYIAVSPGPSSPTGYFGVTRIRIPFYRSAHQKISDSSSNLRYTAASGNAVAWHMNHYWTNTAAINQVSIQSYSSGQLLAGSRLQILGYKF